MSGVPSRSPTATARPSRLRKAIGVVDQHAARFTRRHDLAGLQFLAAVHRDGREAVTARVTVQRVQGHRRATTQNALVLAQDGPRQPLGHFGAGVRLTMDDDDVKSFISKVYGTFKNNVEEHTEFIFKNSRTQSA